MELLDGATLQRIVAVDGAQPAGRVVRILSIAIKLMVAPIGTIVSRLHALTLHQAIAPENPRPSDVNRDFEVAS